MCVEVEKGCFKRGNGPAFGLLLVLSVVFVGCSSEKVTDSPNVDEQQKNQELINKAVENKEEENKGEEEENKGEEEENKEVAKPSMVHGVVVDGSGKSLGDVRVTSGAWSTTTNHMGQFTIEDASIVNNRSVVKFEKSGYFTLTRSGVKQEETYMRVVLQVKGNGNTSLQRTFDARNSTSLVIKPSGAPNAMQVNLRASALARADGSDYTGMVTADMLYLEPNNKNFSELMPGGDLAAIDSSGNETMLISYGMIDVNFSDENGRPLQLKDGSPAELTFPVPAGMENNPPATIPLWSFNEEQGIWLEEGVAQRVRQADGTYIYRGEAKHFSWWNLDVAAPPAIFTGRVLNCNGNPAQGVKVSGHAIATELSTGRTQETMTAAQTIQSASTYTNNKGEYRISIPVWLNYVGADLSYTADISVTTSSGKITQQGNQISILRLRDGYGTEHIRVYAGDVPDFQMPCNTTEASGGVSGAFFNVGRGSVGYAIYDRGGYFGVRNLSDPDPSNWSGMPIVTFDNNGDRIRVDFIDRLHQTDNVKSIHYTIIKDGRSCFCYGLSCGLSWWNAWLDRSDDINCHKTAVDYMERAKSSGYVIYETTCPISVTECTITPRQEIAGRSCDLYEFGGITKRINHAFWNGFVMFHAETGSTKLLVDLVTLDVPPEAFSRSNPPLNPCTWLPSYAACPLVRQVVPLL
ncbi:MAG: hypothetical protein FWC28_06380 [Proteobacteria bacterium]|nr:hypothetical protein [Cystobacterineae bacterium]MCL2314860.1 hypothetical protein [Pseudomonadota bacterium]